MDFEDFYDIAAYGNENWKGTFTPKEIAINAYNYYSDFEWSKKNSKPSASMLFLMVQLAGDAKESNEASYWFNRIVKELNFYTPGING